MNLLWFYRTPFLNNIYGGLFLDIYTKKQRKQRYIDERICFIADAFRVLLCKHYQSVLLSVKKFLLQAYKHIFFKYR